MEAIDNVVTIASDAVVIVTITKQTKKRRFLTPNAQELVVTDKICSDI